MRYVELLPRRHVAIRDAVPLRQRLMRPGCGGAEAIRHSDEEIRSAGKGPGNIGSEERCGSNIVMINTLPVNDFRSDIGQAVAVPIERLRLSGVLDWRP